MKRRSVVLIALLILTLLATLVTGCTTSTNEDEVSEVKIGAIYPLTGPVATTGLDCRYGIELAEEIINNVYDMDLPMAKEEGLSNLGNAPVKFIFSDHQGVPEKGMSEAERLITQEKATAIMGAFLSSVAAPASQVCEKYKVPFFSADTTSPSLRKRDFKWFFRIIPDDEIISENAFQFLDDLSKQQNTSLKRVVLLHENSLWGNDTGTYLRQYADKYGYEVLDEISYPAKSADVTSEVQKIIAADPDVIIQASYVSDAILFMKTFKQFDYVPKALVAQGAGFYDVAFLETLGADGDYVFTIEFWAESLAEHKPVITELNEMFKERFGRPMNGVSARTFMGALTLADAINRAGTTDSEKVREALIATDIPAHQIILPWEGITIDAKDGQNHLGRVMYTQILDQKYWPVWPFDLAIKELVYPMPKWTERN